MSQAPFRVTPFEKTHDRSAFKSGSEPLDRYFHQQVSQDIRRRVTACFVALHGPQGEDSRIADFYTLASTSVLLADLPPETGKKLPRYPSVRAVRIGRLAVDENFKGQGLGGALLADALAWAARADIAAFALVVDAKDDTAAAFYCHHGFIALLDSPLTLFLPLTTARHVQSHSLETAKVQV